MILEPVVGGSSAFIPRTGMGLVGVKDGANDTFTTPDKFIQSSELKIAIYWNARRMKEGRDYIVSEGGGPGTGYNTITFSPWSLVGFLPRATDELVADYYLDLTV